MWFKLHTALTDAGRRPQMRIAGERGHAQIGNDAMDEHQRDHDLLADSLLLRLIHYFDAIAQNPYRRTWPGVDNNAIGFVVDFRDTWRICFKNHIHAAVRLERIFPRPRFEAKSHVPVTWVRDT